MFDELKQPQEINYDHVKTWSTLKNNKIEQISGGAVRLPS